MGCNLMNKKLLDCALIGVCTVIQLNMVSMTALNPKGNWIHLADFVRVFFFFFFFFFLQ